MACARGPGAISAASRRVEHQELADGRQPDRDRRHDHGGLGVHRQARQIGDRHQAGEQELTDHVGRHQAQADPVVAARDAVLGVGEPVGRQADAGEIKRHHQIIVEPGREQPHAAGAGERDQGGHAERHQAAAEQKAAQQIERAAFAVFRNEALGRGAEPEVERLADQQHPGPHIDIDAELEAAHPARQQHLRPVGQHRARHPQHEDGAGQALHQHVGAAELRPQPAQRHAGRDDCCLPGNRSAPHEPPHRAPPRGSQAGSTSNELLTFGSGDRADFAGLSPQSRRRPERPAPAAVVARPSTAFRCGKRPKRRMMSA